MMTNLQPLHPSDVGLILSYRCQSRCAHCIYNCSPRWQESMSVEEVRNALEKIRSLKSASFQVHLTGGEPFLNFPLLFEAVKIAVGLDIPCYLETNAGWSKDDSVIRQRFEALRQAGLQAVLISLSPFHAEYIPMKHTLQTLLVAQEVFGLRRVFLYQQEWLQIMQNFDPERTVSLEEVINRYGEQQTGILFWRDFGLIPGGRSAYLLGNLASTRSVEAFKGQHCAFEIQYAPHSHFDLYGNIIPAFCGGLAVGDWHHLDMVITHLQGKRYSPLIDLLVHEGPYGLYRMALEEYGYVAEVKGYVGKCHLCVDVRRFLFEKGNFDELQPAGFYRNFPEESQIKKRG